ncbi:MAG: helix-hairpin-helix domain-containing protein [Gammaproteobacteria bacterium]|nr:helix-hairpin-helix domain-containing protein [Gammaproteobacteria bacterium]
MKGNLIVRILALTALLWGGSLAHANSLTDEMASQTVEQVNVNSADAETLQRVLTGIGRSKAEAIVAYREANGRFYSAEELTAVRGIGDSTIKKNEDRILVD